MRQRLVLPLVLPFALAIGCAHEQPKAKTAADQPATAPSAQHSNTPSAPNSCTRDLDCGEGQLCIDNRCVDITPGLAACSGVHVHFPFNSSEIEPSDKDDLERAARCLKADHGMNVAIGGNADERGTEEYNLALGDKRAQTVASYLEALGVSNAQLKTVTYGKDNPICQDHDEACWARNRRADLSLATASNGPSKKRHRR